MDFDEMIGDAFSGVQSNLGIIFIAAFALTGVVVAVSAGIKWVKKIGKSS
ncbi:MAG: hypothetical protein LBG60_17845 [Bifidobacteriaceae bacterium]|jgi:hypothetical protein|nr:hypothetical protein [Bifidobacteriaceae bacterium]